MRDVTQTTAPPADEVRAPAAWLPLAAVAVTLVLWASAFVAIRHLAGDFTAGPLSLGRLVTGSVALAGPALSRGVPRPTGRQWLTLATIGVLWFGVYNVALNEGERRIDAGTSSMLVQVSPVLIAVLAALFLSERFTAQLAAGLALAFSGVAVIGLTGSHQSSGDLVGVGLCLLAALVYSVSLVLQKPLVARLPAVHVTWLACTVGAVVCLPWGPSLAREVADAPASSVGWLLYLGVFPTAIAFTTYAYALRHMTASRLGVTTYVVPVLAIAMSALFLSEVPPARAYLGGALALAGVTLARRTPRPGRTTAA